MTTVAVVPAYNRADSVADTVRALVALSEVDLVVVVDDGSADATSDEAVGAGASVVRLPANCGKAAALEAGVDAAPTADVYLLIDADIGSTATVARALLGPVVAGEADMTIGVLPSAGGRGGFGTVRKLARWGIRRGTGFDAAAPLSGQRAIRAELLDQLRPLAPRFGVETGLTIDAVRAGGRVVEVPVTMDHRHTGRRLAGFAHRGRQGADILRALWPRLTSGSARRALTLVAAAAVLVACIYGGTRWEPASLPPTRPAAKVVIVGVAKLGWADVGTGAMPTLDRMAASGAVAAASVRTRSKFPSTDEAFATIGAGTRVRAGAKAGLAFPAGDIVEGASASAALRRRVGHPVTGSIDVLGAAALARLQGGAHLSSAPGALGDAVHRAGRRIAAVGNADIPAADGLVARVDRPAALAAMRSDGGVDGGDVSTSLLQPDADAPFGVRADGQRIADATGAALADADIVVVDAGDTERAASFAPVATPAAATAARRSALRHTDELLGRLEVTIGPDALLLVVGVDPPGQEWRTTPVVAVGAGVRQGYLHSPSVRRLGVITITDIAPTALAAVGAPVPAGMIGHALRYHPGATDLGVLRRLDRDAAFREQIYFPMTLAYIIFQALVYLAAMVGFARFGGAGRLSGALRTTVLAVAAWPLATFVLRAIPGVPRLGPAGADALLVALAAAIGALAGRARRRPLSPLQWIFAATLSLLVVDLALGARLQTSSILGYSLHTAARFTGIGNTAFAVLAASAILFGAAHVHAAPRRSEALLTVVCLFVIVVVVDGAPSLGDDVGGILTLVPLFAVTAWVLSGRRLRFRTVVLGGLGAIAVVGAALVADLLRPAQSRTHLGRLAGGVSSGGSSTLWTTVQRKLVTNLHTYKSVWCWVIVVIALYLVFLLVSANGWSRLLPTRSALRTGVVATLVAGLAGNVLNDSGAVVTALVFVYIGPFLTLLALDRERGEPTMMVAPTPSGDAAHITAVSR